MKEPFKVGDRVKLRGYSGEGVNIEAKTGVVEEEEEEEEKEEGLLKVRINNFSYQTVYPSQCIRLKKKVRRRVWIHKGADEGSCGLAANAWFNKPDRAEEYIEFVEVRKKK